MQLAIFLKSFDGRDLLAARPTSLSDAGTRRLAIQQHGARAALPLAAAVLAAGQVEIIAQHAKQTRCRIDVQRHLLSVNIERGDSGHKKPLSVFRFQDRCLGWKSKYTSAFAGL